MPSIIIANSDDHESHHDEFYKSASKSPAIHMDSVSLSNDTLDGPKQQILESHDPKKFGNEKCDQRF